MTEKETRAYVRQESAAQEIKLDRTAQAYEGGALLPAGTEPLPAFLIMCVVALVLVASILLVG